jgi:hypothetical protein
VDESDASVIPRLYDKAEEEMGLRFKEYGE